MSGADTRSDGFHPPDHERFEACKIFPTKARGTLYPCTDSQLYKLCYLHRLDYDSVAGLQYHPISYRRAAEELVQILRYPEPAKAGPTLRALRNLQAAFGAFRNSNDWGPDLPLKAFHDLDTILFGGYLVGRVGMRWEWDTPALIRICGADYLDTMGVTCPVMKGLPQIMTAEIVLNAQLCLLKRTRESKWKRLWDVVIHEMCHGMSSLWIA